MSAATTTGLRRARPRPRLPIGTTVRLLVLSVGAFAVLVPVMWMLLTSLTLAIDKMGNEFFPASRNVCMCMRKQQNTDPQTHSDS